MSAMVKEKVINIGGVDYKIKFNFKTMMHFEQKTKKNFFNFIKSLTPKDENDNPLERTSIEELSILIQSFLLGGGQELPLDKVADMLDLSSFNTFMLAIPELVAADKVKKEDKKEGTKEDGSPLE